MLIFWRADQYILWRVFTPVAHWIDYRWHINHYRVALCCLNAGIFLFVTGASFSFVMHPTWLQSISVLIAVANTWSCRNWMRALTDASTAYERDPATPPRAAVGFIAMLPPARLMLSLLCLSMSAPLFVLGFLLRAFGIIMQNLYLPMLVCMFYFAGVIPSGRARKPKKERAPAFLPEPMSAQ